LLDGGGDDVAAIHDGGGAHGEDEIEARGGELQEGGGDGFLAVRDDADFEEGGAAAAEAFALRGLGFFEQRGVRFGEARHHQARLAASPGMNLEGGRVVRPMLVRDGRVELIVRIADRSPVVRYSDVGIVVRIADR
jgi:hypothetical protein